MLSNGCVVVVVVYPVFDEVVVDLPVQLLDVEVFDVLVVLPLLSSVEMACFCLVDVDFALSRRCSARCHQSGQLDCKHSCC